MASTASFTEVRDHLSDILDQVAETGEAFTILRHSRPTAVILSIDEYEGLVESLNILSDDETMAALVEADDDADAGRVDRQD